jgi:hypothetical protein
MKAVSKTEPSGQSGSNLLLEIADAARIELEEVGAVALRKGLALIHHVQGELLSQPPWRACNEN